MRLIIDKADDKLKLDFGEVSASLVHEDIIKRGIVRSVAKYMNENPTNVSKINMSRLDSGDYYNLRTLYYDYYGRLYCTIDLDKMLTTVFQPNVAIVDFDSATKDLPDAHFDGLFLTNYISSDLIQFSFKKLNDSINQTSEWSTSLRLYTRIWVKRATQKQPSYLDK